MIAYAKHKNQDKWGIQGSLGSMGDGSHTIAKPLSDGAFAVALWNLNNATATVSVSWSDLGPSTWTGGAQSATVRDIWEQRDLGVHEVSPTLISGRGRSFGSGRELSVGPQGRRRHGARARRSAGEHDHL